MYIYTCTVAQGARRLNGGQHKVEYAHAAQLSKHIYCWWQHKAQGRLWEAGLGGRPLLMMYAGDRSKASKDSDMLHAMECRKKKSDDWKLTMLCTLDAARELAEKADLQN